MLFLFSFFIFSFLSISFSYESTQLKTGVWLSGAAYCGKDKYKTMIISGPGSGFTYKETLYDVKTDLQGYIGILPTTKSIYVVIRGSSSVINWLDDFEVRLVPYNTFPECNCKIHNGFYMSALSVSNKTTNTVKLLKLQYPDYSVVVTGHSYGASCGQILAMELVKKGINVKLYNYGQPRIGDDKYAVFVNTKINEYFRTTHNKDIVPHLPPIEGFGYQHSCREIFEDLNGNLNLCSSTDCEDIKCANQFRLSQTYVDDHYYYLGHRVSCEESTI